MLVELCGFTQVTAIGEIVSVYENGSCPAPVEVHLQALRWSQGCSRPGLLCPSKRTARKETAGIAEIPEMRHSSSPPTRALRFRESLESRTCFLLSLQIAYRWAWAKPGQGGQEQESRTQVCSESPSLRRWAPSPAGHSTCRGGREMVRKSSRMSMEKVRGEHRSPCSALVHVSPNLEENWGMKLYGEQRPWKPLWLCHVCKEEFPWWKTQLIQPALQKEEGLGCKLTKVKLCLLHVWTLNAHQPTDCKYCLQQVYKVETFLRPTARKVGQICQWYEQILNI